MHPTLEEFVALARTHNVVPVWCEVMADLETPISVFAKLCPDGESGFLLESVEGSERVARYSFVGCRPFRTFAHHDGHSRITDRGPAAAGTPAARTLSGNPLEHLRALMADLRAPTLPELPRYYGGPVGYLGFDVVRHIERLPAAPPADVALPDAAFMFTELVAIFDHARQRVLLVATAPIPHAGGEAAAAAAYSRATELLTDAVARLRAPLPAALSLPVTAREGGRGTLALDCNLDRAAYVDRVRRAKQHIAAGDIFQVVLSQRLTAATQASALAIYRLLRNVNPSPYMFLLRFADFALVGASPEMLVRLEGNQAFLRPIAGTRPRGADAAADRQQEQQLLADAKERAEHIMLVDLGRNDLGRVCRYGSVRVADLMRVERYSHVMHLVSDVHGELARDKDAFDLLSACFPAGTLTGAPKVRALELITELEPTRRGPYGGAVGYFAYTGNMDTCIAIRMVTLVGGRAYVQAGAGIVADSDPEAEYAECRHKAGALLGVLEQSGGEVA